MTAEMDSFFRREETLEERLIAAGLGYPLSKEEAVKAYKTMLVFRTDTPEMLDCELCFGVGHDFDAGLPCVMCCEPAKPVLDLIRKNSELRAENEVLRKDAERYRWLRSRDLDTISRGGVFAGMTPQNMVLNEETLDEAIDAAMGKGEKP